MLDIHTLLCSFALVGLFKAKAVCCAVLWTKIVSHHGEICATYIYSVYVLCVRTDGYILGNGIRVVGGGGLHRILGFAGLLGRAGLHVWCALT